MQCSLGIFLDECCKNQSYGISRIQPINEFQDLNVMLLKKRVQFDDISTLCTYHFQKYVVRYRHLFGRACCDPFSYHKIIIKKQLREITVELSEKWPLLSLIPGKSICCTCHKKLASEIIEDQNNIEDEMPFTAPKFVLDEINDAGAALGVSPLKIRRLSDKKKHLEVKRTVKKFAAAVNKKLSDSFNIQECQPDNEVEVVSKDHETALRDIEYLVQSIKNRLKICNCNSEKIQVISVVPHSWSITKTAQELGVTEYLVRKSRSLLETQGIIPEVNFHKCGKTLSKETIDLVVNFYQSDEISRMCSGMKDTKSVRLEDGTKEVKQKRLILCNLKEAYEKYKSEYPTIKIGFSKFCMLRPEWCVLAGPSGTHSVCVCYIHQNVKLMASAIHFGDGRDLISKIVCDSEDEDCMFGLCTKCPGVEALRGEFNPEYEDEMITYKQWVSTDRCNLVTLVEPYNDFKENFLTKLQDLKSHHFIAKSQSKFLKMRKENLKKNECIVIGDFSENYTFVVQDEVQSFHWVNSQATVHPFCTYYRDENGELCCKSVCFLSDCLTHNTAAVYTFQKKLISLIQSLNGSIKKVIYFSDGSASQYKNRKNFANLCKHKEDFDLDAEWHFFATSHGKGPCDGIGGTVKRLVVKASLQRTTTDHILTVKDMYEFCEKNITGIHFFLINEEEFKIENAKLTKRFSEARLVPNTRGNHRFVPMDGATLVISRTSASPEKHNFMFKILGKEEVETKNIKENDNIACVYGEKWFVARVEELSEENDDVWVKFYHPSGPSTTFSMKENAEKAWVPMQNILAKLTPLEFTTATGRAYNITQEKNTELSVKVLSYLKKKC